MRPRATHRHRAAAALVLLALALMIAGCGSVGAAGASHERDATTPEERAVPSDLPTSPVPGALECGARVGRTGGPLTLTGRFPGAAAVGGQQVDGTVTFSARSGAQGVVTPQAEAFLVRDGRIVTLPLAQDASGRRVDLADGREASVAATVGLVPCSGEGTLSPGTYELYARVVLNLDDGSRSGSLGGPWPLELR